MQSQLLIVLSKACRHKSAEVVAVEWCLGRQNVGHLEWSRTKHFDLINSLIKEERGLIGA